LELSLGVLFFSLPESSEAQDFVNEPDPDFDLFVALDGLSLGVGEPDLVPERGVEKERDCATESDLDNASCSSVAS